jgi:glycosyltransferase involved in cell wall biosynthesis
MQDRLVSVITPCYQQGHLLAGAIESVLDQTHRACEMIVINDGSTDETGDVARRYASREPGRVRLLEQANQGQAKARQAGWEQARGEFLVQLDADDLLEPSMVEACLEIFRQEPRLSVVVADAYLVNEEGAVLRVFEQTSARPWPQILEYNPHGALAGVMTRTQAVKAVGGLEVPGTPGCEDWDLWARMARCGMHFGTVRRPLARYRQAATNYSRRAEAMLRSALELLDRCRREDPRLTAAATVPLPPVGEAAYRRLRNGRVFYSLGLAAVGEADEAILRRILAHLLPGRLDLDSTCTQFRWGCRYALLGRKQPWQPSPDWLERVAGEARHALERCGYRREAVKIGACVRDVLTDPDRPDPFLQRVKNRLIRLLTGG